ncbi:GFA family protein [Terrihabitans soli]|nr:GFA family protein [Terrihabitans soli]
MAKKHTAQCACGAVKFEFDTDPTFIAMCHCLDCKKASGGEAAVWFPVPEDDFTMISGETTAFHYIAQSGNGLDRNFCPKCAARLYTSKLDSFPKTVFVQISSLDNTDGIKPTVEMFTKRRHAWLKPLDIPQFTDMPS